MRPRDPPTREITPLIIINIATIVTPNGRFLCNLSTT
jgi:hypothetical protein